MSTALDDARLYAQLRAAQAAQREALLTNPVVMATGLSPQFSVRPHLRLMGRAYAALERGEYRKLLITCPPRVGKSTVAAQWGPLWWLARHPGDEIMLVSYASSLAQSHAHKVRALIQEHGPEFGLYLHPTSRSLADFRTTEGGGMLAAGIAGGLTGRGARLLVIDDPHKNRKEAASARMRETVYQSYSDDLDSRLAPDGATVLSMTRWDEADLAARVLEDEGRLEDGGQWKVIHLPALADLALTGGSDPLGRRDGDPLPHPLIPDGDTERLLAYWRKFRTGPAQRWSSLYQGNPKPTEGALVTRALLRQIRAIPPQAQPVRIAVGVDPSGGGKDSAGIIGGFLGDDGRLYWTHDRTRVMASTEWARQACLLAHETRAQIMVVETTFGGSMCLDSVRYAWDALQREDVIPKDVLRPQVVPAGARVGKFLRAEPVAQLMTEDRVRTGAVLLELEEEWATWQPGSADSPGRIDASVYLAYLLLKVPGGGAVISTAADVKRSDVQGGGGARIQRR